MKRSFLAIVLSVIAISQFATASSLAAAEKKVVVVIEDGGKATLEMGQFARLILTPMAGSNVGQEKVVGKATVTSVTEVLPSGPNPPVGVMNLEIEVKPTAKGKVTVTVPVKYPTGGSGELKYEFEVK